MWFDLQLLPWASWPHPNGGTDLQSFLDQGSLQAHESKVLPLPQIENPRVQTQCFRSRSQADQGR